LEYVVIVVETSPEKIAVEGLWVDSLSLQTKIGIN